MSNFYVANYGLNNTGTINVPTYISAATEFNTSVFTSNQISEESINGIERTSENMNVIAHRGYSEIAPENTIPAFIAAAENGFNTVECDIEWTKDGVPVILHDSYINRTARTQDGKSVGFYKKCSSLTYEQLQNYDFGIWKGEEFKGTKIPTLYDVLDCSQEYNFNIYIELKESSQFNQEKAQLLVDAVKEAGLEDNVTWISFNDKYLKMINNAMPNSRLGYLYKKTPNTTTIDTLNSLKTDENEVFLDIKSAKITKESSQMLQEAGFDFETWTVNDESELDNLYDLNCQAITTDYLTEDEVNQTIFD